MDSELLTPQQQKAAVGGPKPGGAGRLAGPEIGLCPAFRLELLDPAAWQEGLDDRHNGAR